MNKQRILQEAQNIASSFKFWMVSGDISHLYGYVLETPERKYELEIKFDEQFPVNPPELIYYKEIKNLLGKFELNTLKVWTPGSNVVNVLKELKSSIEDALNIGKRDVVATVESKQDKQRQYRSPHI